MTDLPTPPTAEDLARDLLEDLIELESTGSDIWSDLSLPTMAIAALRRAIAAEARIADLEWQIADEELRTCPHCGAREWGQENGVRHCHDCLEKWSVPDGHR